MSLSRVMPKSRRLYFLKCQRGGMVLHQNGASECGSGQLGVSPRREVGRIDGNIGKEHPFAIVSGGAIEYNPGLTSGKWEILSQSKKACLRRPQ